MLYLHLGPERDVLGYTWVHKIFLSRLELQWWIQDFPEEGAPTIKVGTPTYYIAQLPQKLHENEKKMDPEGGARPWRLPWIPQCKLVDFNLRKTRTEWMMQWNTRYQNKRFTENASTTADTFLTL